MYQVSVKTNFKSAHQLRSYEGKCEKLHGHNWDITVVAESRTLNKMGVVIDFQILKERLDKIVEPFDHARINNIAPFDKINPTAENIARYIHDQLAKDAEIRNCCRISEVIAREAEGAEASYVPD